MKTATDSIAVIRTRLPYLDRRALSEAWFSALHLAREGHLAIPQRRAGDPGALASGPAVRVAGGAAGATRPIDQRVTMRVQRPVRRSGIGAASPVDAASKAEKTRAALASARAAIPPPLNATFVLTIDGARVQMLVRRDGPALRVTAICAAAHVESVRRALASADIAMRLRGHVIESTVRSAGEREVSA